MEGDYLTLLELPTDVWTHILENLIVYDKILLQTTCKCILKLCRSKLSWPVPDNLPLMYHFAELGSISCLEYLHALGQEWDAQTISAAAGHGHIEVIKFLKDNGCEFNSYACAEAAGGGHFECLKYLHENGFPWSAFTAHYAARSNNFEILKYLHENGCEWDGYVLYYAAQNSLSCLKYALENNCNAGEVANQLCGEAAYSGNMECLKYLFEAGFNKSRSCEAAAQGGRIECLKYAHENGGEWGKTIAKAAQKGQIACIKYAIENGDDALTKPNNRSSLLESAVTSGSIECVKFVRELGCTWNGREYGYNNKLQVVKYLVESGCPKPTTNTACLNAAGNLELLKYLHENGFRWNGKIDNYDDSDYYMYDFVPSQTLAFQIVIHDNIPCLEYIIECGYEIDTSDVSLCNAALSNNNILMLDYLIDLGCECDPDIMSYVTRKVSLESFKYLHESGFEWDDNVPLLAAEYGRPKILEYALANGCEYNSLVYSVAAEREHLQCIKIAHKYGVPWTANACLAAVRSVKTNSSGLRMDCLKYLHENGCPWTHQECTEAVKNNDLQVLKYLHENGSKWSKKTWYAAVKSDAIDCLKYMYDSYPQNLRNYLIMHSKKRYEFFQSKTS